MSGTETRTPQDEWVWRTFGFDPRAPAGPGDGAKGQAAWTEARSAVVSTLDELARAIAAMKNPLGDKAIILVRSISANLTAAPSSRREVQELRRYLETDSVIDDAELPNGFGIEVRIRAPLLHALDLLDRSLPAS